MRQFTVILMAVYFGLSVGQAAVAKDSRELNPHWAQFKTPRYDKAQKARIAVPHGYRLCSTAESYSSLLWFYIPLDKAVRCEDLPKDADWKQMPDFVVIAPSPDTPMTYENTSDVVKDERFYCHGLSYDHKTGHQISNAPTTIASAGKALSGLDTVTCTRQDDAEDKYSRAFLAYRPQSDDNDIGREYEIAAYVHTKNRGQADKLLEQIVKSFKLLD